MKRTLTVMTMVIALALSTMAGAVAKNGNAPGHENENAAVKYMDYDSRLGTLDFLGNKAGFHLWFTVEADTILANNSNYEVGNSYHNIYKWVDQVGELGEEWCGPISLPDREPYNLAGQFGDAYYKIWDVTEQKPVCGTFEIVSGDVSWTPTAGPNAGVVIASTFTAYMDGEGGGSGQIVTTNTKTEATSNTTIDCVLYEDDEVWMSGTNIAGDPVVAYARAGGYPAFNQWTNPNVYPQDCTAKWSGASQFISGTIQMF